ncbi:hypothetical protein B0T19DRAFT_405930 [Cercophora scortea]|uniref:Uncharacterized protein n=1 Tax=Cercophora scortea TaxID=314031 RepID=A0AAE0J1M6_9PEZI|nr:hypothetical protein B0T19DRAFT_405930 [Cercophora scortea]
MSTFSAPAAAASCAALSQQAQSTAFAIDALLLHNNTPDAPASQRLAFLSTKLQQFHQHAEQLGDCLAASPSIASDKLQTVLARALPECKKASTIVTDQVKRVSAADLPVQAVDLAAVSAYEELLVAFSRVFIFATQILAIEERAELESYLEHDDGQQLLAKADSAYQGVVSSAGLLLEVN